MSNGYSKHFLIDEYWRFVNEFGYHPNSNQIQNAQGYPSKTAYKRMWGNWRTFLLEIGVIETIEELKWVDHDINVLIKFYASASKEDILKMFQSNKTWKQAVRKAKDLGLTRPRHIRFGREEFTKEFLIKEFWRYFNEFGVYPLAQDIRENKQYPSDCTFTRRFGSWDELLKEIDVLGEDHWYKCDEEVLKNMYSDHSTEQINDRLMLKKSHSTIQHKANKMGLKKSHKFRYGNERKTDEELLNLLNEFYKNNLRNPITDDFDNNEEFPNHSIYRHRFGSWNNALELAGLTPKYVRKDLTEADLQNIKQMYLDGDSVDSIATKYGYSETSPVYYLLRKMDVKLRNNRWTKDQISLLYEHYPHADWDELLAILHPFRKEDITTKAYMLGISRDCYGYSDAEIDILNNYYGKIPFKELVKLLPNKSESSIMTKASKLGLKYREFWDQQEIEELKNLYPNTSNEELSKIFNRSISSISSMAGKILKINKTDEYMKKMYNNLSYTKRELLDQLKNFSIELGKTPTSQEVNDNKDMAGTITYHRIFGGYASACEMAGLEVNQSLFGEKIEVKYSRNNDMCFSKGELMITNFLIDNGIDYIKEFLYKDIIDDERCGMKRCDWLVNGTIMIEYFGMPEKSYYKARMKEKIRLCDEHGVELIQIYPNDLKNNLKGLKNKLKNLLVLHSQEVG